MCYNGQQTVAHWNHPWGTASTLVSCCSVYEIALSVYNQYWISCCYQLSIPTTHSTYMFLKNSLNPHLTDILSWFQVGLFNDEVTWMFEIIKNHKAADLCYFDHSLVHKDTCRSVKGLAHFVRTSVSLVWNKRDGEFDSLAKELQIRVTDHCTMYFYWHGNSRKTLYVGYGIIQTLLWHLKLLQQRVTSK